MGGAAGPEGWPEAGPPPSPIASLFWRSQKQSTTLNPLDGTQLFRITHVFHPHYGRDFTLVDRRNAWGEDRVFFHDDAGKLRRVPSASTSAPPPDAFVEISAVPSHFPSSHLFLLMSPILPLLPSLAPPLCA